MIKKSDQKEENETKQRRDAGIARMLNTPPKPFTKKKEASDKEGSGRSSRSCRPSKQKIRSGD